MQDQALTSLPQDLNEDQILQLHQFHTQEFIILSFMVMPQNILESGSLIFFDYYHFKLICALG